MIIDVMESFLSPRRISSNSDKNSSKDLTSFIVFSINTIKELVMETGGEVIRNLRLQKGLSLKELSDIVSANYVYLSKLERGLEAPSENLIKALAEKLNFEGNIDELIASFGKVPTSIKQLILDDPSAVIELPAFFKSRRKK
jgi:transcriptional regulator with XRE-family HTH domain